MCLHVHICAIAGVSTCTYMCYSWCACLSASLVWRYRSVVACQSLLVYMYGHVNNQESISLYIIHFLPAGARAARERLVLRWLYVFRVCLFVRPHLSRAQYITSYVTMQLQCTAAFGGLQAKLQQMKVVLCCLDGENVVGSRKDPGYSAYTCSYTGGA